MGSEERARFQPLEETRFGFLESSADGCHDNTVQEPDEPRKANDEIDALLCTNRWVSRTSKERCQQLET